MDFMELTDMSAHFKAFLIGIAAAGLSISWYSEKVLLVQLSKWIGVYKAKYLTGKKTRKEYKVLEEEMRL